jgi:CheY-like chemotaxis protein
MNRKLALRQLAKLGIDADAVSGGEAAVEAVATHRYPVVLMDCQMPIVDGYEATRQIRARENGSNRCRIIAMTAGAFEEDRMACLAAGMDDYLAKPVTLRAMQLALEGWIPAAVV